MTIAEMTSYILKCEEEIAHFMDEAMMAEGLDFGNLQ